MESLAKVPKSAINILQINKSKEAKVQKSKIEWTDYTINPVKGLCPMACSYCYARAMYKRFKWAERLEFQYAHFRKELESVKKPSKIFVGSTMELFGDWIQPHWIQLILEVTTMHPQHTFIFLTKQPQNLIQWSPFPSNVWVGVSATNKLQFLTACHHLSDVKASVKFLSFEPLLESVESSSPIGKHLWNGGVNWVIVGRQTPLSAKTMPHIIDIQKIIHGANEIPIPVFLKNNLSGLLPFAQYGEPWKDVYKLRQEFPKRNIG